MVSIRDRGFLYGDGCFETLSIHRGRPRFWREHMERLDAARAWLRLRSPSVDLAAVAGSLIHRNRLGEGLLRIQMTRGCGPRGDSLPPASRPGLVLTLHPLPAPIPPLRLAVVSLRLDPASPLCRHKTTNRILWMQGRAEAEGRGADEALFLTTGGEVACAASASIFWQEDRGLYTPPLSLGILPGITRGAILSIAGEEGVPRREEAAPLVRLKESRGAFLARSTHGILPIDSIDGAPLPPCPLGESLRRAYWERANRTPFP